MLQKPRPLGYTHNTAAGGHEPSGFPAQPRTRQTDSRAGRSAELTRLRLFSGKARKRVLAVSHEDTDQIPFIPFCGLSLVPLEGWGFAGRSAGIPEVVWLFCKPAPAVAGSGGTVVPEAGTKLHALS